MRVSPRTLAWAFFLALLLAGPRAGAEEIRWSADLHQAWHAAKSQDRPLLMFVTMPNCHYCELMKATWRDPRVSRQVNREFVAVQLDSTRWSEYVQRLNLRGYPSTLVVAGGRIVVRITGYVPPAGLSARLDVNPEPAPQ